MRFSKLVSGISSLAIASSMFAGLAVTANAADTITLSNSNVTVSDANRVTISDDGTSITAVNVYTDDDETGYAKGVAITGTVDLDTSLTEVTTGVVTLSATWATGDQTGSVGASGWNTDDTYSGIYVSDSNGNEIFDYKFYGQYNKLYFNGVDTGLSVSRSQTFTLSATIDLNKRTVSVSGVSSHTASSVAFYNTSATGVASLTLVKRNCRKTGWDSGSTSMSNISYGYDASKEAVNSITVKYQTSDGNDIVEPVSVSVTDCYDSSYKKLTSAYAGDTAYVPFRKYVVSNDGKLYTSTKQSSDPYYGVSTVFAVDTVITRTVSEVSVAEGTKFIALADGDGDTSNNSNIRASYMSSTRGNISLGTVESGIYKIVLNQYDRNSTPTLYLDDTAVTTLTTHTDSWGEATTTDIAINKSGSLVIKDTAMMDYVLLYKTGEYTAPSYTDLKEVETNLTNNTAGDGVYARAFTFTANPNDGSYSNVTVAIGETSKSVSDTVVSGTGDIVYGIIVSSTDADKVNAVTSESFAITLN